MHHQHHSPRHLLRTTTLPDHRSSANTDQPPDLDRRTTARPHTRLPCRSTLLADRCNCCSYPPPDSPVPPACTSVPRPVGPAQSNSFRHRLAATQVIVLRQRPAKIEVSSPQTSKPHATTHGVLSLKSQDLPSHSRNVAQLCRKQDGAVTRVLSLAHHSWG